MFSFFPILRGLVGIPKRGTGNKVLASKKSTSAIIVGFQNAIALATNNIFYSGNKKAIDSRHPPLQETIENWNLPTPVHLDKIKIITIYHSLTISVKIMWYLAGLKKYIYNLQSPVIIIEN